MYCTLSRLGGLLNSGNSLLQHRQNFFFRNFPSGVFMCGVDECCPQPVRTSPSIIDRKYPNLAKSMKKRRSREEQLEEPRKFYDLFCISTDADIDAPKNTTRGSLPFSKYLKQLKDGLVPDPKKELKRLGRYKDMIYAEKGWDNISLEADNVFHDMPYLFDHIGAGSRFLADGDLNRAILAYEAALNRNSRDSQLFYLLAECYTDDDSYAEGALTIALKIDPLNQNARLAQATIYGDQASRSALYGSAMYTWDVVIELDKWLSVHMGEPSDCPPVPGEPLEVCFPLPLDQAQVAETIPSMSRWNRRTVPIPDEYYFKFEKRLGRALEMNADDVDLLTAATIFYSLRRNFKQSEHYIRTAIKVGGQGAVKDARLWNRLGIVLSTSQNIEGAKAAFLEAVNMYPNYVAARHNLGKSCINLGEYREAIDHLLLALDGSTKATYYSGIYNTLWLPTQRVNNGDLCRALRCHYMDAYKKLAKRLPK